MQIWQLSSLLDTMSPLWSQPIQKRLFLTLREPSVNRKYLLALTLVGPPRDKPELDPLAVLHLNNPLNILPSVN